MYEILLVIHVLVALMLIGIILLQHGKGAQAGAAFGSGASQTVFGSQGSGGFLSRSTSFLALIFFSISLFLAYYINKANRPAAAVVPVTQEVSEEQGGVPAVPSRGDIPEVP